MEAAFFKPCSWRAAGATGEEEGPPVAEPPFPSLPGSVCVCLSHPRRFQIKKVNVSCKEKRNPYFILNGVFLCRGMLLVNHWTIV